MRAPRVVWGALILIGLASIGGSLKVSNDTHQTNDDLAAVLQQVTENQACLFGFIAESSRVSKIRSAATGERDDAINHLLNGVADLTLKPSSTPSESAARYRQLLADYKVAATKLRNERKANPLPDLPASCADLPPEK